VSVKTILCEIEPGKRLDDDTWSVIIINTDWMDCTIQRRSTETMEMEDELDVDPHSPPGICCDGTYIYVLAGVDVLTLDLDFNLIDTLTTFNGGDTFYHANGGPRGICCDDAGYVYVGCYGQERIVKFTASSGVLTYDSEIAGDYQFLGLDTDGTYLFACTAISATIEKRNCSDLSLITYKWQSYRVYNDVCHVGDYIYVTSPSPIYGDAIQKRNVSDLELVSSFGSTGSGDNQFDNPVGISTDGTNLYICDWDNERITKYLLDGTYVDKATDNITYVWGIDVISIYSIAHIETPSRVTENGVELTSRATLSLCAANASSWYYDSTNTRLYVHTSGSDDPGGGSYVIMSFGWWERLSTHAGDYNSKPYLNRLEKTNIPNVSSSVSGPHEGIVTQSLGQIRINNLDARYDARLALYVYEGAKIILYRGIKDDDYANFDDFIHAYVGRWECDESHLTLYLEDFRDYI